MTSGRHLRHRIAYFIAILLPVTIHSAGFSQELLAPPRLVEPVKPTPQVEPVPEIGSIILPRPVVTLRYVDLLDRNPFSIRIPDAEPRSRDVGQLQFMLPEGEFPKEGLSPTPRGFCVEPMMPMHSGLIYTFAVDPIDDPKWYDLPDTEEGRASARRRADFVYELYGKHYSKVAEQRIGEPSAFQIALWELVQERDLADKPNPFNLYKGTFQTGYENEAAAPEYVRTAQGYLRDLTGNSDSFKSSEAWKNSEIVRLTALRGADEVLGQSQFMLRTIPLTGELASITDAGNAGLLGPLSLIPPGSGGSAGGFPSTRSPSSPTGSVGGGGGGGGAGGGFPYGGGPSSSNDRDLPVAGPIIPTLPTTPGGTGSEQQPGESGAQNPGSGAGQNPPPDGGTNPGTGPGTGTGTNPGGGGNVGPGTPPAVPAPPAIVLGLCAVGVLGLVTRRRSR